MTPAPWDEGPVSALRARIQELERRERLLVKALEALRSLAVKYEGLLREEAP